MKVKYRVYELTTKTWLDPIWKAYDGVIVEPNLLPNGELSFKCRGIPELKDGDYHTSYLEYKFGCKFEIHWDIEN